MNDLFDFEQPQPVSAGPVSVVTTADGKTFESGSARLVGSVSKMRNRDIHKPARIGEFPVFVEQSGSYRMFTYTKKITAIDGEADELSEMAATLNRATARRDLPAALAMLAGLSRSDIERLMLRAGFEVTGATDARFGMHVQQQLAAACRN